MRWNTRKMVRNMSFYLALRMCCYRRNRKSLSKLCLIRLFKPSWKRTQKPRSRRQKNWWSRTTRWQGTKWKSKRLARKSSLNWMLAEIFWKPRTNRPDWQYQLQCSALHYFLSLYKGRGMACHRCFGNWWSPKVKIRLLYPCGRRIKAHSGKRLLYLLHIPQNL